MTTVTQSFATWVEFQLHADTILKFRHEGEGRIGSYDPELLSALRIFISASGHNGSSWGRLRERPETVIIVSSWKSQQDFVDFRGTSEYLQYWTALSDLSVTLPTEKQIRSSTAWPIRFLRSRISIFSFSFPTPVSDDTKEAVYDFKGLAQPAFYGGRLAHRNWQSWPPTKAWVTGREVTAGIETETMMYICWWGSDAKEIDYCTNVVAQQPGAKFSGENRTRLDSFKLDMEENWAAHIKNEFHCRLVSLPRNMD